MTIDTTAIAYQYKRVYGDMITDLFKRHTMTWNQFDMSNRKAKPNNTPAGAGFYFGLRTKDVEGVGARNPAGTSFLPEPIAGAGTQGVITPKAIYAVIRMTGMALAAGKSDIGAMVEAQGDATMNAYNSLVSDLNRQCHADGFGGMATLSATSDTLSTSATWTLTCDNDVGVRYLKDGMIVDFYESNTLDASSKASRISSIDPVTKIVTMEANSSNYITYHPLTVTDTIAAGTIASGAVMVRYGARSSTSHATTNTAYEINGLNALYDDGTLIATFEGVSTTSFPKFKATILGNSSVNRELSEDLMIAACDIVRTKSTKEAQLIRMGQGQRRKYFALLSSDRRYAPVTGRYRGGFEMLDFSAAGPNISMIFDPQTQPNRMYFEPTDSIKKYELEPIGWGGFDPNKMHWRENYDQATMYLRTYADLGVEDRQALVLLDDLTEPGNQIF
jgi:hypothetical protein